METTYRRPSFAVQFLAVVAVLAAFAVIGYWAKTRIDTLSTVAPQPAARPTLVVPPAPAQQAPVAPVVVPTANIPAVQQVQFEPAPPASVPVEQVQPRTEIINVQRAPEQTTITRTVPNKPAGPPIVIDKGVKQRGAPRP